ncbi:MAG: N-acetyltransferase [Candidatus Paceibacterota bacterium]
MEKRITLETATDADIDEYIVIGKKVQSKAFSTFTDPQALAIHIKKGQTYSIRSKGRIAGFISCEDTNKKEMYLSNFAIDPQFQGQGIAREAVEGILSNVEIGSVVWLVTHPENIKALNLYKSFGFKVGELKENYFGDGEPRIVMTLLRE